MNHAKKILGFDLGAESGRGLVASFDGERVQLEVVHRFPNGPVRTLNTLHWDVLRLYSEMLHALRKANAEHGALASVGIDTWGVDFALLGKDGSLLGNPRHYRDPHTENIMEQAFAVVPRAEIFRQTGLQFMRFNSLFQLLALARAGAPQLEQAENLLFIPDLFHYWFTGEKANEYTDASTSQMLRPAERTWARELVRAFGIPDKILGPIIMPGKVLGPLHATVASQAGVAPMPVLATATHDTAAAVAAVPAKGENESWAYISSGTWSLMGVEIPAPLTGPKVQEFNFTNEGGAANKIRLLKNIMGLWLVQECRRTWEREGLTYDYDRLMELARAAPAFGCIINPDDASFILPASMPAAIAEFARKTGQPPPPSHGATVRCALEGLALRYRWVLERLEELVGREIGTIHIVGGGSLNTLLCQFTADACNRPVLAGPVEATALGNVLVQAIGLGLLGSLADARAVVRRSFELRDFAPNNPQAWEDPYRRFLKLLA